jgi:hypothetical protein
VEGAAVAALCDWHPPLSINADKVVGTPEKGGVKYGKEDKGGVKIIEWTRSRA